MIHPVVRPRTRSGTTTPPSGSSAACSPGAQRRLGPPAGRRVRRRTRAGRSRYWCTRQPVAIAGTISSRMRGRTSRSALVPSASSPAAIRRSSRPAASRVTSGSSNGTSSVTPGDLEQPLDRRGAREHGEREAVAARRLGGLEDEPQPGGVEEPQPAEVEDDERALRRPRAPAPSRSSSCVAMSSSPRGQHDDAAVVACRDVDREAHLLVLHPAALYQVVPDRPQPPSNEADAKRGAVRASAAWSAGSSSSTSQGDQPGRVRRGGDLAPAGVDRRVERSRRLVDDAAHRRVDELLPQHAQPAVVQLGGARPRCP